RTPANRRIFARLAMGVETAKRRMSEIDTPVEIPIRCHGLKMTVGIDRARFERRTADLLERTRDLLLQIVKAAPPRVGRRAAGGWGDIDSMIIVGGASRMPMVSNMVRTLVKGHPGLIKDIDPEMSISHGA